jgi:hypothetical protein
MGHAPIRPALEYQDAGHLPARIVFESEAALPARTFGAKGLTCPSSSHTRRRRQRRPHRAQQSLRSARCAELRRRNRPPKRCTWGTGPPELFHT